MGGRTSGGVNWRSLQCSSSSSRNHENNLATSMLWCVGHHNKTGCPNGMTYVVECRVCGFAEVFEPQQLPRDERHSPPAADPNSTWDHPTHHHPAVELEMSCSTAFTAWAEPLNGLNEPHVDFFPKARARVQCGGGNSRVVRQREREMQPTLFGRTHRERERKGENMNASLKPCVCCAALR
ncbi:hypothetical protein BV898_10279 [Hypsibius exemplaris]|uniref:Uncharacterized protein n=1 Tax=Hypsibius exemplaris TaxID=2072580 RepID=A0A1W0WK52_HYPEX|nr:hypothetical protein BV898_10279 [Hypsibius exemplaris]